MADAVASLTAKLAESATGYGAIINGVLDPRTVTAYRNGAALNAMYVLGTNIISSCQDPACECMVELLKRLGLPAEIVPVRIEVQR